MNEEKDHCDFKKKIKERKIFKCINNNNFDYRNIQINFFFVYPSSIIFYLFKINRFKKNLKHQQQIK